MKQERLKKLEGVVQDLISRFIFEEIEDSEQTFGIITITSVKISQDLSYLDIFVSCFQDRGTLAKTLAKHAYAIQHKLNDAIPMRKLPRIRFRYDDSGVVASHVTARIHDLTKDIPNIGLDSSQNI